MFLYTESDYQDLFSKAIVWIQPGGTSKRFLATSTPELKNAIRRFVSEGGGYVGFCAGAFAATATNGSNKYTGLGIFPGKTSPYPNTWMNAIHDRFFSFITYNKVIPQDWYEEPTRRDPDGLDHDVAADMVKWASKKI